MKLSIYSIYDTVAQVFNKPFTDINDATATRAFKDSVKDQPHSKDYCLYKLADYFDNNGSIQPLENPLKLISGFETSEEELPSLVKTQAQ